MKTCEEMAQAVIRRADEHRIARRKWITGIAAAVLGVCVLGVGAVSLYGRKQPATPTLSISPTTNPTIAPPTTVGVEAQPTTDPVEEHLPVFDGTTRTVFMSTSTSGTGLVQLQENISLPMRIQMIKRDLRGLPEEEVEALCKADSDYADSVIAQCPKEKGYIWTQNNCKNVSITTIISGHFLISVEDRDTIETVRITTTGIGQLTNVPHSQAMDERLEEHRTARPGENYEGPWEYEVNETNIHSYYCLHPYNGIGIGWMPDGRDVSVYDPDKPLSTFNDTITITIRFKDGVVETHVIDLQFSEDGQGSAIYRGMET